MCLVSFIPTKSGFLLTSNRDESPRRAAHFLQKEKLPDGQTLLFPRDTGAGGTWICASTTGRAAVLLNGAFQKHHHQPPYRKSRGVMLLELFVLKNLTDFFENYDFRGIEPFTLLVVEQGQPTEFRWDGESRFPKKLDPSASHIYSSCTLYPPDIQQVREAVFRKKLASKTPAALRNIHLTGSLGNSANDFVMNRNGLVETISLTQIIGSVNHFTVHFQSLLDGKTERRGLRF